MIRTIEAVFDEFDCQHRFLTLVAKLREVINASAQAILLQYSSQNNRAAMKPFLRA
jgi:hypothetical protein